MSKYLFYILEKEYSVANLGVSELGWEFALSHFCSFKKSEGSTSLFTKRVTERITPTALFVKSDRRECHLNVKSDGSDSFQHAFPLFMPQNKRVNHCKRCHSFPSLIKKEQPERFALLKRVTRAIRSHHSLPNEWQERLALWKERITLLLSKTSDEKQKSEWISNPDSE